MTSTDRKKILVFSDWYLPGFKAGGPIRSLVNLVNAVPHDFYIVTGSRDHQSSENYQGVAFNCWIAISEHVKVIYLTDDKISSYEFRKIMEDVRPDMVYLNSLFSPKFTLLPLRVLRSVSRRPKCIVAPRGMLKSGALSIKGFKKRWFLRLAKLFKWYEGIRWHATNEEEVEEIRAVFGNTTEIVLSPNLSAPIPSNKPKPPKAIGELRLVCIARISPEKGILEAIQFLGEAALGGNVSCDFIGTQQNRQYLNQCVEASKKMDHIKISFTGEIHPDQIQEKLCDYHFFYMPSWGENFGHSIAEALHSSTPVIISENTPWKGLEARKAGWELPLHKEDFVIVLRRALAMPFEEYMIWSKAAGNYALEVSRNPTVVESARRLFNT